MAFFPVFLSVVYVVRNQGYQLESIIHCASEKLSSLVTDYELIIVDNASDDESINVLKNLTGQSGYPNLQVYALTKEVDGDTASWVGLENALGDFVAVIDPQLDDIGFLPEMLDKAVMGADMVYARNTKKLGESIDRGMRLLVSTTQAPMRLVTSLSLFGAAANLVYSVYVVAIGILKTDVAPGWVSMSLQQSGMFFLISLVLLVLGEYILHMASLSNEGPLYHVGQEFTSARMTRREKLNIEDVSSSATHDLPNSDQVVA